MKTNSCIERDQRNRETHDSLLTLASHTQRWHLGRGQTMLRSEKRFCFFVCLFLIRRITIRLVSYLNGTDGCGRQRLQVLRVQKVSRPCSQHFQHLYGKSAGLARRISGRDAVVHGLLADPLPRRAALPRWIGAISQDRDRGRCDHDPILVKMVKEFMCVCVFLLRLLFPKINE